jgi:hypothetical protein
LASEGAGGAIAGDFVVLDLLRGANEGCVEDIAIPLGAQDFAALVDQADNRFTLLAFRLDAKVLEDGFQTVDVLFRLSEMILKRLFEAWITCLIGHLRERFGNAVFGIVQVFEFMLQKLF